MQLFSVRGCGVFWVSMGKDGGGGGGAVNTGDDRRGTDGVLWKLDLGLYHIEQQQELKFSRLVE